MSCRHISQEKGICLGILYSLEMLVSLHQYLSKVTGMMGKVQPSYSGGGKLNSFFSTIRKSEM
jgi:hypothetical protein